MKDLVARMQAQFDALVKKYSAAAAELELSFVNAGASEADFAELEQTLGYALPEEFKELYRVANGETDIGSVFAGEEWLSIERIIDEYNIWQELYQNGTFQEDDGTPYGCEPEAGIKPDFWWNPKWISLTADGGGNGKMIDLDPSKEGKRGQIIQMWHDDADRSIEAESLKDFFEKYAQDLEKGLYVIHPDYGIILKEDLDEDELAELEGKLIIFRNF